MSDLNIYHNPRCSKSRQTLSLIEESGNNINIIEYLKDVPSADDLRRVVGLLGVKAKEIVRTKEDEFKGLNVDMDEDDAVIAMLVEHPKLIERPIVWNQSRAVVGRPPENVKALL